MQSASGEMLRKTLKFILPQPYKGEIHMYTPQLTDDLVRALYQLKLRTKKPMTVLLDMAVREFVSTYQVQEEPEATNQLSFLQIINSKTKSMR